MTEGCLLRPGTVTDGGDVQVEALAPCKGHLASLEIGQKSFQTCVHHQSRELGLPGGFLNSGVATLLPVLSTSAPRAGPCFLHTLLLPEA